MKKALKNKKVVMILAMVLMVALVAGMGAMTYSRYVSSADMGDAKVATVAKWGYVVTFNAADMFPNKYETDADSTLAVKADSGNDVVKVSSTNSIVAPGTTGSMTIVASGVAEVLAEFAIELEDGYADITLVKADGSKYNPIKWSLKHGDDTIVDKKSLAELATKLNEAKIIQPSASINETFTITWEWALDSGADTLDTLLGYFALNGNTTLTDAQLKSLGITDISTVIKSEGHVTGITFDLSATIKQIQD